MLAEYAPKGKRGIISSLVAMGTNCGTLSATAIWAIMFFLLDREQLIAWGWRIPFLASVVVMIFAIWLRLNLKESPVFEQVNEADEIQAKAAAAQNTFGAMLKVNHSGWRPVYALDRPVIPVYYKHFSRDIWFKPYYLIKRFRPMP